METAASNRIHVLRRVLLAACEAVGVVLYARLRYLNSLSITEPRVAFGDTRDYLLIASQPFFSSKFWLADKPFMYPLFLKIVGTNAEQVTAIQLYFSILCWAVLAIICALLIRSYPLKFAAFAVILGFSLSQQIILWDSLLLTESLSFSLGALFYASGLWLSMHWTRANAAVFILLAAILAYLRDATAYMFLMAGVVLVVLALGFRNHRGRLLGIGGSFVTIFVVAAALASAGHHGERDALLNVLVGRILPNPAYKAYMEAEGMPVSFPPVPEGANPFNWFMLQKPAMASLRSWAALHGKPALLSFYWHFKADTLQKPLDDPAAVMAPDLYYYSATGFEPILEPTRFAELLYPMRFGVLGFWLANLSAAFLSAIALPRKKVLWLMPLLMVLLSYPQIVFIWNTDPHDILRHALPLNVQWRLGAWLLLLIVMDGLLTRAAPGVRAWLVRLPVASGIVRILRSRPGLPPTAV